MIARKHVALTAVDFLDFQFLPVRGETPKFFPDYNPWILEFFAVIDSIVSTTRFEDKQ